MQRLVVGFVAVVLLLSIASCAGGASAPVPSLLLELEQSRDFDARATETCTEAQSGPLILIASSDSSAGQIRQMYDRGEAVDPSSVDVLPADPETYAALCLYDASEVADFPFDLLAYWVSRDSVVGGTVVIAAWSGDDVER